MDDRELLTLANEARGRAYAPYSKFPVGAALLCRDGAVFTGVNVENAVNGLSLCAERVALFKAISEGHRDFVKIAVTCRGTHCRPCGACRQVLHEHAPDLEVLMGNPDGAFVRTTVRDLLPDAFSL
ncbi:MAG: cytidine deaminase [Candidatus Bipolaricaulis sp.]|nr:cytidine deaminase [Candidatus Bipolaricaulis sp.]MDD5219118.1 cytidine deaminase [Candidatus Bipolaricaulis sp.]MDD5646668.1 cytidine deaminase [Candidatus Bipolaricaulis sp.]